MSLPSMEKACLHLLTLARIASPKHCSMLNTHSNDFTSRHMENTTSRKQGIPSGVTVRGEGGVAPLSNTCW